MMKPIITTLMDTDFYKLTMLQAFYYYENAVPVEYKFYCRNKGIIFTSDMVDEIKKQITYVCELSFTNDELKYIESIPYFQNYFIRFLKTYKLNYNDIIITNENGNLDITISAPIIYATLWEIYLLSIINEVYFDFTCKTQNINKDDCINAGLNELDIQLNNIKKYYNIKFAEFGTRRRFSRDYHELVIKKLNNCYNCIGTSNVDFARRYNMKPIGTMAHEWILFHLGVTHMNNANKLSLERWQSLYEGALGTALTDTFTTDYFLKDFNGTLSRSFDGVRHDSGCPYEWTEKMIDHYKKMNIDYTSKLFLYSDGLNIDKAINLYKKYNDINISFGIGTFITNNIPNMNPLNIVIKMTKSNGFPTIKISDTNGKVMCEDEDFKQFALNFYNNK